MKKKAGLLATAAASVLLLSACSEDEMSLSSGDEGETEEVEAEEDVQVQDPEAIAQGIFDDDILESTYQEEENAIEISLDFGNPFLNSLSKGSFEGDIEEALTEYNQLENVPSATFNLIGEYDDVNDEEVMDTVYLYEFSADTIAGLDTEDMPDLEEAADTFVDKQDEIEQEKERIEEEEAAAEEARQEEEERKEQEAKEEAEERAAKEKEEAEKQAAKEEEEKQQAQEEKEKEEQKAKEKAEQEKKKEEAEAQAAKEEDEEENNDESNSEMINDNVLDYSYDIMLDYEGVQDVHAEVDEETKTISLAIIVGSATNEEYAKDLADSFIRSMASGAGIYGDESLEAPDKDSLGELYDYYDLHVGVATSSEEYIVQGAKAKGSRSLIY